MKRYLSFVLAMVLLLSGCGVASGEGSENQSLTFYYCVEGTDQLTSSIAVEGESRAVQVFTLAQLMELYLSVPVSDHLRSPFPDGTRMIAQHEGENGLEITMSGGFFTLQGIEFSIEICCLAKTLCEYLSVDHITVQDEMGAIRLTIAPDSYLLENSFNLETESVFTLYFPDESRRYLVSETREVTLSENESPETYLLRQLMQGPHEEGLVSPMPKGTELLDVSTEGGICFVSLSEEFFDAYTDAPYEAYTAIYSLVNTLTGLEYINGVQLLRNGKNVENCSVFSLQEPLVRYSGSVGLLRPSGTEIDINVYVLSKDGYEAFGVPVRVKQTVVQPLAEAVAQAAISFEAPQGFYNPIPYGTELLSISMSGNICYVDVSRDFIPSDGTQISEQGAVWALVTSLTDQSNIGSVVLTIEGDSTGLSFVDISQPLTPQSVALG